MGELDAEKKENVIKSDPNKSDLSEDSSLSEFTEQRMFDDLSELIKAGTIDVKVSGKKTIRTALEQKYGLKEKALRKHKPFKAAFDRIVEMIQNGDFDNEE